MALPTKTIIKTSGGKYASKSRIKFFRRLFIFLFIIVPMLYAIVISVQAKDLSVGIEYFVPRLLEPVNELNDISLEIIDGSVDGSLNYTFWKGLGFIFNVLSSFYVIYLWLWVFAGIWSVSFVSDRSRTFINWSLAFLTFITLQWLYLLIFLPEGLTARDVINLPFVAIKNLFRALPHFIIYMEGFFRPNNISQVTQTQLPPVYLTPENYSGNLTNVSEIVNHPLN